MGNKCGLLVLNYILAGDKGMPVGKVRLLNSLSAGCKEQQREN